MQHIKLLFFLMLFFVVGVCYATTPEEIQLYDSAKTDYHNRDYTASQIKFDQLLQDHPDNGYLLFNLANVYYKMGELGKAIQYYEKARLKIPRVPEVKVNLDLMRKGQPKDEAQSFTDYLINNFYFWSSYITVSEFRLILLIVSIVFWGMVFYLFIRSKKILSLRSVLGLLILLYFAFGYYLKSDVAMPGRFAVVIKPEVDVKAIYMVKGQTLFQLHSGTKVRIIDRHEFNPNEKWLRIVMPEGQKGWVLADDVGVI